MNLSYIDCYFAPVQVQARHHLHRLAQCIRRVTGTLHECQQLDDPFFFFRTLQVELISEAPAGRRNLGEAEFAPLVEFPRNRKLRPVDPQAKI